MPELLERVALAEAIARLEELVGEPAQVDEEPLLGRGARAAAIARIGNDVFLIEVKGSSSPPTIAGAASQLLRYAKQLPGPKRPTLLLVVPYMPPSGRAIADDRGVSWLDLSGNAHIRTPRTLIRIEGEPNRFKERGRPSTPFAPKSSRIARWFLMHPGRAASQQELAEITGVVGRDQADVRSARLAAEADAVEHVRCDTFRRIHGDEPEGRELRQQPRAREPSGRVVDARVLEGSSQPREPVPAGPCRHVPLDH